MTDNSDGDGAAVGVAGGSDIVVDDAVDCDPGEDGGVEAPHAETMATVIRSTPRRTRPTAIPGVWPHYRADLVVGRTCAERLFDVIASSPWGGASEALDLDVLVFINLPFMGQDPRWDKVNLSRAARAIVKSVAIEVSPISYTQDTLGPIWTRDAEVLIWRRRK